MANYDIDVDSVALKAISAELSVSCSSLDKTRDQLMRAKTGVAKNRSLREEGYADFIEDAIEQLDAYRKMTFACAEFWGRLAELTEDYERYAISLYNEDPYSTSEPIEVTGPYQANPNYKQRDFSRTLTVFGIPLGGLTVRVDGAATHLDSPEDIFNYLFTGKATGGLSGRMGGSAASMSFDLFIGSRDNNFHVTAGAKLGNAKVAGGASDEFTGVGGIVSLVDVNAGLGITHGGTQGNISLVVGGGSLGGLVGVETNPDSKTMDADAGIGFLGKIGLNYHRDWSRAEGYKRLHLLDGSSVTESD